MKNIFKKYFGDIVSLHEMKNLTFLFLKRRMFQVNIDGISFILIEIAPDDKFPVTAFKKQIKSTENSLLLLSPSPLIFSSQRDSGSGSRSLLIRSGSDHSAFSGMILSNRFRLPRDSQQRKKIPSHSSYFYIYYQKESSAVKFLPLRICSAPAHPLQDLTNYRQWV